ncbi:MAG: hypothetical protein ABL958_03410 [Bdellovibrionia bacterium]
MIRGDKLLLIAASVFLMAEARAEEFPLKPSTNAVLQPAPNLPGRKATGGFGEDLKLHTRFGTFIEVVSDRDVNQLLAAHSKNITDIGLLEKLLRDAARDRYIFSALKTFFENGGRFHAQTSGGHYRAVPFAASVDPVQALIISIGLARNEFASKKKISPADFLPEWNIRETAVHEIMHYVLDKMDATVSETLDMGAVDHTFIDPIQNRFTLIRTLLGGGFHEGQGGFVYQAWKSSGRRDVHSPDFLTELDAADESAIYGKNEANKVFRAQNSVRVHRDYSADEIHELKFMRSINVVLVQESVALAEAVKPKNPRDAFKDEKVREIFKAFLAEFMGEIERAQPGSQVLARGRAILQSTLLRMRPPKN